MNHADWNQLRENESWRAVLAAYAAEQTVLKVTQPEHDGWVSRLKSVTDVSPEDLAHIHGRLMAYGFLKFQLAGRTEGLQYQVSSFGREALSACDDPNGMAESDDESVNAEAA